ncbi:hypothetical protein EW146_g6071, partial [Bondarzewia mesenterica]
PSTPIPASPHLRGPAAPSSPASTLASIPVPIPFIAPGTPIVEKVQNSSKKVRRAGPLVRQPTVIFDLTTGEPEAGPSILAPEIVPEVPLYDPTPTRPTAHTTPAFIGVVKRMTERFRQAKPLRRPGSPDRVVAVPPSSAFSDPGPSNITQTTASDSESQASSIFDSSQPESSEETAASDVESPSQMRGVEGKGKKRAREEDEGSELCDSLYQEPPADLRGRLEGGRRKKRRKKLW